jgi:hypothetical protein
MTDPTPTEETTDATATKCEMADCTTVRTDEPDYSPVQAFVGQQIGWYSGDDGEICPKHLAEALARSNRVPYTYYEPGGTIGRTS